MRQAVRKLLCEEEQKMIFKEGADGLPFPYYNKNKRVTKNG